jgi:uncharacterized protein with PQ loop repeat
MPVTPADVALGVFTVCNTLRVFAYLPQIVKISRDTHGADAISYTTWALFGLSHLSTMAYAIWVVSDWRMAAVFAANTLCCITILGLTAWKRALFRASRKARGHKRAAIGPTGIIRTPAGRSSEAAANLLSRPSSSSPCSLGAGRSAAITAEGQILRQGGRHDIL